MEYRIRFATIEDLKKVQTLNLKLFEKEYSEFDRTLNCKWTFSEDGIDYFTYRLMEDDGCVLVACVDDEIVGYLAGGLIENKKNIEHLQHRRVGKYVCA